jgi:RNA polymerase sigma-70 factor, ECF subfamily
VWIEPYPDERLGLEDGFASPDARYEQRESVELAFVAALQNLPPRQRAVLILREVLGFSAEEVADVLDTTATGVYSALQRAHKAVDERLPERSQQQTLRSLEDDEVRRVVEGFVDAWVRSDVDTVVSMLAEDVAIAMPPTPTWFRGRDVVAQFLRDRPLSAELRWRGMPIRANGQLGAALYRWDDEREAYLPHDIVILTLRGDKIEVIDAFLSAEPFERFGLPDSL